MIRYLVLPFLATIANAGVTQTVTEQQFKLTDGTTGSDIKELVDNKSVSVIRKTLKECQAAGEVAFRKLTVDEAPFRCVQVTITVYKGTCDDEPAPGAEDAIEGIVNEEGFTIVGKLETEACLEDDTDAKISVVKWRKKPSWRDGCWERIETPIKECGKPPVAQEVDPSSEIDTDYMSPWIAGQDYPYGEPCPKEALGGCWVPSPVPTKPCPPGAEERCGDTKPAT